MLSSEKIKAIADDLKADIIQYRNARKRVENSSSNTPNGHHTSCKLHELIKTPNFDSLLKTNTAIETDAKQSCR